MPERPTALTPQEQTEVDIESIDRNGADVAALIAIIRRLDVRVGELEAWKREAEHTIFEAGKLAGTIARERNAFAAQIARLREAVAAADKRVSDLHDLLWPMDAELPRRVNDLIWLLHDRLRAALHDAEDPRNKSVESRSVPPSHDG